MEIRKGKFQIMWSLNEGWHLIRVVLCQWFHCVRKPLEHRMVPTNAVSMAQCNRNPYNLH